jgi:DNA-binding FrmR family transcriptional regulator
MPPPADPPGADGRQEDPVDLPPQTQKEIVNRLRRAAGQIEGVIAMMESGRSCKDVVTQLSAASRALDRAGYKLIATSMKECLLAEAADPGHAPELTPDQLEQLFLTLS